MLKGEYQSAFAQFSQAVNNNPLNTTWLINLADTEYLMGNIGRAQKTYQNILALTNEKDDWESLLVRSQAHAQLGNFEAAIRLLLQVQHLVPDNAEVYFNSALIYALIGEHTSALVQAQLAIEGGIGAVWFRLPWFDTLCNEKKFIHLLSNSGESSRCH